MAKAKTPGQSMIEKTVRGGLKAIQNMIDDSAYATSPVIRKRLRGAVRSAEKRIIGELSSRYEFIER